MDDYILSVTAFDGMIRGFFINSKNVVNDAFKTHTTSPVVTASLGRLLTASLIIGKTLKKKEHLVTIKINGDGPLKNMLATANNSGYVKGYPSINIVNMPLRFDGKLNVGEAIGNGNITIIKDIGLKQPYNSISPLITGEIAEDLTYYFAKSEQIPTSIALGVLVDTNYSVKQAGGFMIQIMPNFNNDIIDIIENNIKNLNSFTTLLEEGKTVECIAKLVLGVSMKIKSKEEVFYKCDCSKESITKAFITIGKKEIKTILNEDKEAEIFCHFCNTKYNFDEQYLKNILNSLK